MELFGKKKKKNKQTSPLLICLIVPMLANMAKRVKFVDLTQNFFDPKQKQVDP